MTENIRLAEQIGVPICQDTGTISFYLMVGDKFSNLSMLPDILRHATKHATEAIPLRPNAVNPFTGKNSGDNIGESMPYIHWEIVEGNNLQITALPKGGGSENACALGMLEPGLGIKGIKKFVVDTVIDAGAKPCPPTILGVGIGGGADIAINLAKKALLRNIGSRHNESIVADLERELEELVNQTGIGPMGLGGDTTTLGVNVEYAHRHPASLPVAVMFQCWASRRASAKILFDGKVEYLSHRI
ncbi:MAG: fumarate hydratase subunit alpha [Thermoproteota archaeon]|nr:fumarate hydratase subunit alpha [Thermoproteota archaeon]